MEVKWFVLFAFAGLGICCVAGKSCDVDDVNACYNKLVHYEGLGFPLYGEDEQALDETCESINESFDCLDDYLRACNENAECDDKCKEIIQDIGIFILNTGLRDLQEELCNPLSPMRLTYLDNYVCLEDNADHYAKCHNDSQLSQEYMSTITDRAESLSARCCFFNWYDGCFTNVTRDTCNANATFFVSMSLHKLTGHIVRQLCQNSDIVCSRPPLPAEVKPVLTNVDSDECSDESCRSHSTSSPGEKTDMTNIDVDNCLDGSCGSGSNFLKFAYSHLFISLCSLVLLKYLF